MSMIRCNNCEVDIHDEINNYLYVCTTCGIDIPLEHTFLYERHLLDAEALDKERELKLWALEYAIEKLKEEIPKIKEDCKRAVIRNYEYASSHGFPFTATMTPPPGFTGTMTPPPAVQAHLVNKGNQMIGLYQFHLLY